jgi:hypothetical protein
VIRKFADHFSNEPYFVPRVVRTAIAVISFGLLEKHFEPFSGLRRRGRRLALRVSVSGFLHAGQYPENLNEICADSRQA